MTAPALTERVREELRRRIPLTWLPQPAPAHLRGTWREARPGRIEDSLAAALDRPTGGWQVAGASADVPADRSLVRTLLGREIVLWRDTDGSLLAGPGSCPHLGALLDRCDVVGGQVLCRWHGMPLGRHTTPQWARWEAHDDGVLIWVRLPESAPQDAPTERPVLPVRPDPSASIAAVVAMPATCEPRDIIANRLDPWHGAWLHPYAFSHLAVDEEASSNDRLVLDVAFRLGSRVGVPVRADFTTPDRQSIVMTILEGEGAGSVVETHASALTAPGVHPARTMMTEATIATSPRVGFQLARHLSRVVTAGMRATARQLWVDDLAYAERTYTLRRRADG